VAKIKYRVEWKDGMGRVGERWVRAHTSDDVADELDKLMRRHVTVTAVRLPYTPPIWVLGRVIRRTLDYAEIVALNRWFVGDRLVSGERQVQSSITGNLSWRIRTGRTYPGALPRDVAVGDRVVLVHVYAGKCMLGPEKETYGYLQWLEEQEPFTDGRLIQRGSKACA
jgi:hypothetical protein